MTTGYDVERGIVQPIKLENKSNIAMESITENEVGGLFDVTDDGMIVIDECGIEDVKRVNSESGKHINPKILKWFMKFLKENSGKTLVNLNGYKALNRNDDKVFDGKNSDNFVDEDIEIGKMLLPDTDGFSLKLSVVRVEETKANISFKFFGINGAAHVEFERSISQEINLSNVSTRLTIHVRSKVVRFVNKNDDFFYWRKILYLGQIINTVHIDNDYLSLPNGYGLVERLNGQSEAIFTTGYKEPREIEEIINKDVHFEIGCDFKEESYINGNLGLSGEMRFIERFCLHYIIPPGNDYMFHKNDRFFENIWAVKT